MDRIDELVVGRALSRDQRLSLTLPALRAFFAIAQVWQLTTEEQLRILGLESRSTLARWRRGEIRILGPERLERISYVLGIFRAINVLLPVPERANRWMHCPNERFGGRSALQQMLSGNVGDLHVVRRYLDSHSAGS